MAGLDAPSSPIIYPREKPRPGLRLWILVVCVVTFALMLLTRPPAAVGSAAGHAPAPALSAPAFADREGISRGDRRP